MMDLILLNDGLYSLVSVTKEMMATRGIDTKRVIISEPETIQKFRHTVLQLVDNYAKEKDRPPMMMVLDSLGPVSYTHLTLPTKA